MAGLVSADYVMLSSTGCWGKLGHSDKGWSAGDCRGMHGKGRGAGEEGHDRQGALR